MIEVELNNFLYREKYHEKYHEQAKIKRYEENPSPNLRCVQMVLLQYFYPPNLNLNQKSLSNTFRNKIFKKTCR